MEVKDVSAFRSPDEAEAAERKATGWPTPFSTPTLTFTLTRPLYQSHFTRDSITVLSLKTIKLMFAFFTKVEIRPHAPSLIRKAQGCPIQETAPARSCISVIISFGNGLHKAYRSF
jgi:hypothetical protein